MPEPKSAPEVDHEAEVRSRVAVGTNARPAHEAGDGVAAATAHSAPLPARADVDRHGAFTLVTAADHAPAAVAGDAAAVAAAPATKQDYLAKVYKEAGIDEKTWDVGAGFSANLGNVTKSYEWYAHMYHDHPQEMQWAGMAKLAGARVFQGLAEVEAMKEATKPSFWREPEIATSVMYLQSMHLEKSFLTMQKDVFQDLAWQHRAFADKGLPEMERLAKAGDLTNPEQLEGWRLIAGGKPAQGNEKLLHSEQHDILQPFWTEMGKGLVGSLTEGQISRETKSPIPGGKPFRAFEPDGSIGDFNDRWKWIHDDMLPAWQHLPADKQMEKVMTPLPALVVINQVRDQQP